MTGATPIARHAAARLAATLGPDLPAQVERELNADSLDPPTRVVDPVSLAALLVSVASLAWTIWHDLKKDHAARSQSEQAEALAAALALSAPHALQPPQRALLLTGGRGGNRAPRRIADIRRQPRRLQQIGDGFQPTAADRCCATSVCASHNCHSLRDKKKELQHR